MSSQLARFTGRCTDLSQKAVVGDPEPPVKEGDGGYADWIIVAVHGPREYLDHPYWRLLDVLHEMPGIASELGLSVAERDALRGGENLAKQHVDVARGAGDARRSPQPDAQSPR